MHEHAARYELARQVAVDGDGEGWRHGLGLLATKGVAAWMGAWAAWAPGGARNRAGATPSQAEPSSSTPTQKGGEPETGSACTSFPPPAAQDVVAVLAANPGLSAAEVTARTAMDKVAVSRAVATLQSAGRLQRTTAPADRRRTHLALTAAGTRVYAQVVPMALKYERQLVAPLSKQELALLDRVLRVLLGRAVELGPAHVP